MADPVCIDNGSSSAGEDADMLQFYASFFKSLATYTCLYWQAYYISELVHLIVLCWAAGTCQP